jgi:thioredoxin-related protein
MTKVQKLSGAVALLLVLVAGLLPAQAEEQDNRYVHWLTYREALEKGASQEVPILVHFTASHSGLCRKMKRETYQDRKVVRYLNEHFAVTMIDVGEVPSLARKYGVKSAPVLWFLDAKGKRLTSIEGEVGPEKMLRVAEYISEKIYEHTDYNTWLDQRSRR